MSLSKKYIKVAFNQYVTISILLGVLPFSFVLGLDIWAAITSNSPELFNFNNMITTLSAGTKFRKDLIIRLTWNFKHFPLSLA